MSWSESPPLPLPLALPLPLSPSPFFPPSYPPSLPIIQWFLFMIPDLFHAQSCHLPLCAFKSLKDSVCHLKGSAVSYKQNTDLPLVRNDRTDCLNFTPFYLCPSSLCPVSMPNSFAHLCSQPSRLTAFFLKSRLYH